MRFKFTANTGKLGLKLDQFDSRVDILNHYANVTPQILHDTMRLGEVTPFPNA